MSFNNIKTKLQAERGFTIVELLIVIVVIGILAAITIVSFNGVTARANTANAVSAVNTVATKAEAYNSEPTTTGYPSTFALLTGATAAGTSYLVTGVTFTATAIAAAPTPASTINFYVCGTAAGAASTSAATTTVVTGNQVKAWDFSKSAISTTVGTAGQTSGTAPNTYAVSCWITAS
ncbi:MAG TPA: prepilin-type N-terminal cleavage/methylation domain-containing protein [Candidatus Microsaccharimonas sp.]|jgi:type IV pilus assembly protein PilA